MNIRAGACNALFLLILLTSVPGFVMAAPQQVKNEKAAEPEVPPTVERKKVFNAEAFMLDNGLEVIVVENKRAPVVTHMVWYRTGAADEIEGHSGLAHFLEHMMFKGSERIGAEPLKPGEFSQIVRSLGGQDNAFTSKDYTAYYQSVPAAQLETVMRMEAGRMKALSLPPGEIESERKVVLEERRQRTDNDPRAKFHEQMVAQAFINHPYGVPVIGWKHEMEKMQGDQLIAFHDTWYAPNNAILIVTGDVSPAAVYQLAIDIYGQIPRKQIPKREWSYSPPLPSPTVMRFKDPVIQEPSVQTLYRVPSYKKNKEDALALDVLAEIMAGGSSGRIYQSLVVEKKIATGADLSYDSNALEDSQLWVYGTPVSGQSLDTIKAALDDELRKVIAKGVTEAELKEAITRLQDQTTYALDSLSGPAMAIGGALVTGSTLDDVEYWPYDIANVTATQVQAVAFKYLNPDKPSIYPPVTGYLEPAPQKPGEEKQPVASPAKPKQGAIR